MYKPPEKVMEYFGKHSRDIRIWHVDLLEMAPQAKMKCQFSFNSHLVLN